MEENFVVKIVLSLLRALLLPLVLINMLGWVVSGIWLAWLGEWRTIGLGLVFLLASLTMLGLALVPSLLISGAAAACFQRRQIAPYILLHAISGLYVIGIQTVWCCGVLFFFTESLSQEKRIPTLLWSYAIATAPWSFMASKDRGEQPEQGFASRLSSFLGQVAYLVIVMVILNSSITQSSAVAIFAAIMLIGLALQLALGVAMQREYARQVIDSDC